MTDLPTKEDFQLAGEVVQEAEQKLFRRIVTRAQEYKLSKEPEYAKEILLDQLAADVTAFEAMERFARGVATTVRDYDEYVEAMGNDS